MSLGDAERENQHETRAWISTVNCEAESVDVAACKPFVHHKSDQRDSEAARAKEKMHFIPRSFTGNDNCNTDKLLSECVPLYVTWCHG